MKRCVFLLPAAIFLVFQPVSQATIVTYANRASWLANSTGVNVVDFENIAPPGTAVSLPGGLVLSSVNFKGYNLGSNSPVSYFYAVDSKYHPNPAPNPQYAYDRGTGASIQAPNGDPTYGGTPGDGLLITLPGSGKTSVGGDFWAFFFEKKLTPTATFEVTFLNGATNLGVFNFNTVSYPNVQFFGATSTTPITQMFVQSLGGVYVPDGSSSSVNAPSTWIQADNFSFGSAAAATATPEPSTFMLFPVAFAGLWMYRRSRIA